MTANVTYLGGGRFSLSITDNTTHKSFATTASAPVGGRDAAQLSSAEWVVERAATISKGYLTILPLATFDAPGVTFTDASYKVGNGGPITLQQAVDNDTEYAGYPADPPAQPYWEHMFMYGVDDSNSQYPLDEVSVVSGNSFDALFVKNGEPFPIPGVFRH